MTGRRSDLLALQMVGRLVRPALADGPHVDPVTAEIQAVHRRTIEEMERALVGDEVTR